MKWNKSSRDIAAFQMISYKFHIGETRGQFLVEKTKDGNIKKVRIKITGANNIFPENHPCKECSGRDFGQVCSGSNCIELIKYLRAQKKDTDIDISHPEMLKDKGNGKPNMER